MEGDGSRRPVAETVLPPRRPLDPPAHHPPLIVPPEPAEHADGTSQRRNVQRRVPRGDEIAAIESAYVRARSTRRSSASFFEETETDGSPETLAAPNSRTCIPATPTGPPWTTQRYAPRP